MHWIPARLKELGKTGADLAKALGLNNKQRAYAIWTPDKKTGKTRKINIEEAGPLSSFLQLPLEEILMKMGRPEVLARHGTVIGAPDMHPRIAANPDENGVHFRAARAERGRWGGFMLYGDGSEVGAATLFYIKVIDEKNEPVYRLRDRLTIDPGYPIITGEDCVFSTDAWPPTGGFCVIARLLRDTPDTWFCQSIVGAEKFELDRAEFKTAWPIVRRERPAT